MNTVGRALDRVLLHSYYVIPDGHPVGRHVTHWDTIMHPPLGAENMNWHGFPNLWWRTEEVDRKSAAMDPTADQ
ncbi:MAG TPA: hypothetical protein DCM54_00175 [Gammaproteobacteria bacterium]|nr:hypothetical protein [Gammaproteobacteria bacterium]